MSDQRYIGIDPGVSGGIAWIDMRAGALQAAGCVRMPESRDSFAQLLRVIAPVDGCAIAAVEKVHAVPGVGSTSSSFTFGCSFERPCAILATLATDTDSCRIRSWGLVPPQVWQRALGLGRTQGPQRKRLLKHIAVRKFPQLGKLVTLSTCDALLIADYLANGGRTI